MEDELNNTRNTQGNPQETGAAQSGVKAVAGTWADEIQRIKVIAPEWHEDFEESDPFIAPRPVVQRLMDTAPDAWARGLIMGIDMFRVQIAACTGRVYE
ncbi:MAG: hypothetical protein K0Q43_70 [Ramlibacter sp.]|jgi:hypothetical protein|nr:hypothetical protein [Ramlibacter sp.]